MANDPTLPNPPLHPPKDQGVAVPVPAAAGAPDAGSPGQFSGLFSHLTTPDKNHPGPVEPPTTPGNFSGLFSNLTPSTPPEKRASFLNFDDLYQKSPQDRQAQEAERERRLNVEDERAEQAKIKARIEVRVLGELESRADVSGQSILRFRGEDARGKPISVRLVFLTHHRDQPNKLLDHPVMAPHRWSMDHQPDPQTPGARMQLDGYWRPFSNSKGETSFSFEARRAQVMDGEDRALFGVPLSYTLPANTMVLVDRTSGPLDNPIGLAEALRVHGTKHVRVLAETDEQAREVTEALAKAGTQSIDVRPTTPTTLAQMSQADRDRSVAFIKDGKAHIISQHPEPQAHVVRQLQSFLTKPPRAMDRDDQPF